MAMVASVEKITIEEGTEPRTRIEHARYDGGERDGEDSLRYSTGFPLCDACMLLKSFEDIGEGTQGERGELRPLHSISISSAVTDMKLTEDIL
jgi:hypothetical protein